MPDGATSNITVQLNINVSGHPLSAKVTMPAGRTRPRMMLPIFQGLTDSIVGLAQAQVEANGGAISCTKGCGACCRQLVPISQVEANFLLEVIEAMPAERRQVIRTRFDAARQKLAATGLLGQLEHPEQIADADLDTLGIQYFAEHIPCPFLEDESCSIHVDRPLACREYLVTSPAANCAEPRPETIDRVSLPGQVSLALLHLRIQPGDRPAGWVPLIVAPHWAEQNPEIEPTKTGPEMLEEVMARMVEKRVEQQTE